MNAKTIRSIVIGAVIALFVLVIAGNSCSVVRQRERGIDYTFGKVEGDVLQPGLVWHAPFVTKIQKYSIAPKTYDINFQVGNDKGAITKDLQTVAASISIRYNYDPNRIMDIAMKYGDSVIESLMETRVTAAAKAVIGQYTIYELIEKQTEITSKIAIGVKESMTEFPIEVTAVDITNWSWSDAFDEQIQQTALRTQQIKTAQQEADISAAQAMKKVKEAEANKQAAELDAQAEIAKANGSAEAQKIRANAQAYENQKIAQNLATMQAQWRHEEAMEKLQHWNGKEVSDQSVYVPNTYDLKTGK